MILDNIIDIFWKEGLEFDSGDSRLAFTKLVEEYPCILAAEDHPLASCEAISAEDLFNWTLILPQKDDVNSIAFVVHQYFSERYPQIQMEVSDLESSDYLAVQNGSKVMLFLPTIGRSIPHVRAIPFACGFPMTQFGFVHKADPTPFILSFIQTIQASL